MERYTIANDHLKASILSQGAELCQLAAGGEEFLWDGDPAVWARQAPNLFPIVGGLKDDRLLHQGRSYTLPKHGFARDKPWTLVRLTGHSITLRLRDDAETLAQYPFPFSLSLGVRLDGPVMRVQYDLLNPGEEILLASLGAHPAFRWPLRPGLAKEDHWLDFEKTESDLLPALDNQGLLVSTPRTSPLADRRLNLQDRLFSRDALIFQPVRSKSVRYVAKGGPTVEVAWDGFPQLGVWTRPGAGFLCIEPWRGYASPAEFEGEFKDKPGVFQVSPGATVTASYTVRILG